MSQLWTELEDHYGKAGGVTTYLQLVNMVKIQFTDLMDLLPQIQEFQNNYAQITLNGHSKLSEDLTTFMFCSSLPDSYEPTAWQYLDNIMNIANYKVQDTSHEYSKKKGSSNWEWLIPQQVLNGQELGPKMCKM